jgi:hypothetical protein
MLRQGYQKVTTARSPSHAAGRLSKGHDSEEQEAPALAQNAALLPPSRTAAQSTASTHIQARQLGNPGTDTRWQAAGAGGRKQKA